MSSSATRNLAPKPPKARQEDELKLCNDWPFDAEEQVVEAAVLEVVLDSGAADPADAAVDDRELAMVDMPECAQVPAHRPVAPEWPDGRAQTRGAHGAHLDACRDEMVVELPC